MAKANGDDVSIAEFQAYLDKLFGALGRNACAMEEILKMCVAAPMPCVAAGAWHCEMRTQTLSWRLKGVPPDGFRICSGLC